MSKISFNPGGSPFASDPPKGFKPLDNSIPIYIIKPRRQAYPWFEITCLVGAVSFIAGLWFGSWISSF